MREVVLDTETTGLDPAEGHRIVEIGAVELWNHLPTGRTFHRYLNPERSVPTEAFEVHGLGDDFLRDKPFFAQVAQELRAFIEGARLVIHTAAFDLRFLNAEFSRLGLASLPPAAALDTLAMARARFPGAPASLDALCRRFGVDLSARTRHGALLDCELLAEVYLELVGGRQPDFGLSVQAAPQPGATAQSGVADADWRPGPRPRPLAPRLSDAEKALHMQLVEGLGPTALWLRYDVG
jgi:DNA polymerase-3 subunit epsilon